MLFSIWELTLTTLLGCFWVTSGYNPEQLVANLMGEASTGLMPIFVDKVFDALGELNRRGVSILLVEQNARKSLSTMSRGYLLQTGQISLEGSSEELRSNPEVQRAYLGI